MVRDSRLALGFRYAGAHFRKSLRLAEQQLRGLGPAPYIEHAAARMRMQTDDGSVLSVVGLSASAEGASPSQPIRWRHVSGSENTWVLLPSLWLYGGLQENSTEPSVKASGDAGSPEKGASLERKGPRRRRPRPAMVIPETVHAELNIP